MKIGHSADHAPAPVTSNGAPATNGASQTATTAIPADADPSARIALSSTASTLLSGGVGAEFDAEKVARMTQAIENGTFRIDAGAIADKLIANAQELLNKTQG